MNANPFLPVSEFPDFPAMTPAAAEEAFAGEAKSPETKPDAGGESQAEEPASPAAK